MSDLISEVLAELRGLIGGIDEAAVLALRAQTAAQEAFDAYKRAGTGTEHPEIRKAQVEARTAAEKAGKTARLLAEAASAFADYVNVIAPGTVPARHSAPEAAPSGEKLADEAPDRRSRLASLLADMGVDADDKQEAIATTTANLANGARIAFRDISGHHGPHGSVTVTPTEQPEGSDSTPGTPIGDFASAMVFTALGTAVAVKGVARLLAHRHDEEKIDDH